MKIQTLNVAGIREAMMAMRNPKKSRAKNDTTQDGILGTNDRTLTLTLQKAGPEHAKHLRMIIVWVDITAPFYWWKQFDTYRAGVEKLAESTMHTITRDEFVNANFEYDNNLMSGQAATAAAAAMNSLRGYYLAETDPKKKQEIWRVIVQNLPESYLQMRTVMVSYAALRNMIHQRIGHKLPEWRQFIAWCRTLPEADTLLFNNEELNAEEVSPE
jgi:hypothetical protein